MGIGVVGALDGVEGADLYGVTGVGEDIGSRNLGKGGRVRDGFGGNTEGVEDG